MMLRTRIATTVAVVTAISLAGCAPSESADSDTGAVTISFQAFSNTPEGEDANGAIVDAWNDAHPETQVDLVMTPIDTVYDKLSTQMVGGTAPDLVMDDAQDIRQYVEQGYIADLTGLLSDDSVGAIDPQVLDTVSIDGILAGIPTEMQTYVVFANKRIFDAAGVQLPSSEEMTLDEFEDAARSTTSEGVSGVTWGLKSPMAAFMSLGVGNGARYFDGEGRDAQLVLGDAELDLPNRVLDLIKDGAIDPVGVGQSSSDVIPTFYAGKAAMILQQSYHIANFAADAPEGLDWVVLPPLAGSEGTQQAASPTTISVTANSEHPDLAAKFLDFYLGAENLANLNLAEGLIPPTQSGRDKLADLTVDMNGWAEVLHSGENLVVAPANAASAYPGWKGTVANAAFQQFLSGAIDERTLIAQLTEGWEQSNL